MLIAQSKKVEELEAQVAELNDKINSRELMVEKTGNLAIACLKVNEVFQTAQAAADQYLENIRILCEKKKADAELEAMQIRQKAADEVMKRYN